ncbi:MAG: ATP-grasp domain-containing protein [Planctomycetes bacterium]|nr:ATP-grasp domain-containing protein [Planctomycetota bacterium]
MNRRIVILGASARAAACSATHAGFVPAAADLFGDRDLTAIAEWTRIEDYPHGAAAAAERLSAAPWIYTGGMENHPQLIDRIAPTRPLLGNPGHVLRRVRDPYLVARCLRDGGLSVPELSPAAPPPGTTDAWLRKPLRSCGGHGIRRVDLSPPRPIDADADADVYYQRFIPGRSYAAVYVAGGGEARLVGITRQLTGEPWTGANPFAYCGSLGPVRFDADLTLKFERIGNRLAESFGLVGLIGVDVIVADRQVYVLEVNPRFVASIEVLERSFAGSRRLMQEHIDACCTGLLPKNEAATPAHVTGKAILYATRPTRIDKRFSTWVERANHGADWPPVADIPNNETQIDPGHPILTLRTEAATPHQAVLGLRRLADLVRRCL